MFCLPQSFVAIGNSEPCRSAGTLQHKFQNTVDSKMTSIDTPSPVLAEATGAPVERRRRVGGRGGDRTRKTVQGKYMNLVNTYTKTEVVTPEGLDAIHEASFIILEEIGMDIILPEAREIMKAAGADVTPGSERVRFDRHMIMDFMSSIPKTFTMHARNPLRNVQFGGNNLVFAQTASEPFVADREGGRRAGRPGRFPQADQARPIL